MSSLSSSSDQRSLGVAATSVRGAEPFLRWAGGKRWLADYVGPLATGSTAYYEPFLGAAAVFLATLPTQREILSDMNGRLIEVYREVRDRPEPLIGLVQEWPNSHECFMEVRAAQFGTPLERAAQFVYLNRTCWNGLYRVNKKGRFNVPYGNNPERQVLDADNLVAVAERLQSVELREGDFASATRDAGEDAFVYFDPPYATSSSSGGFLRYNSSKFSWEDQVRLAAHARRLADRGCRVVVSNAASCDIAELYGGFESRLVERSSRLAGTAEHRRGVREALFLSFKPPNNWFSKIEVG